MTHPVHSRYLAVPQSGYGPGVLVLHAWWGLNGFFREFCDRLAQAGFVALAPDLYSGKVAGTVAEAERLRDSWDEAQEAPPLVLAGLDALIQHPAVRGKGVGVIGFSMGGRWALWLAEQKPDLVRAVTVFYSTGEGDFSQSKAAFQGHFAAQDPYEPEERVRALEKRLREANRPANFYTYPGAGHWFFEKDRPEAYHPQAAKTAWDRTIAFLHESLDAMP